MQMLVGSSHYQHPHGGGGSQRSCAACGGIDCFNEELIFPESDGGGVLVTDDVTITEVFVSFVERERERKYYFCGIIIFLTFLYEEILYYCNGPGCRGKW